MIRIQGSLITPDLGEINEFVMNVCDLVNNHPVGYTLMAPYFERTKEGYLTKWTIFAQKQHADRIREAIEAIRPKHGRLVNRMKVMLYYKNSAQ